jgi:hypothetical protein
VHFLYNLIEVFAGRTKKRWLCYVENDMRAVGVYVGNVKNRDEWRFRTEVADLKWLGERRGGRRRMIYKSKNCDVTAKVSLVSIVI